MCQVRDPLSTFVDLNSVIFASRINSRDVAKKAYLPHSSLNLECTAVTT